MNNTIQIRELQLHDAEQVAALTQQLGYVRTAEQIAAWIATHDANTQAVFVAHREEEVLGWIEVSIVSHLQSERHTLIGGLVVKDGTRGLGIGRMLCLRVEQWTLDHGIHTIRVTSNAKREDAHRFYLRDGYETVKTSMVFEKHLN